MIGLSASRDLEKTASEKRPASPGSRFATGVWGTPHPEVTWPLVARVLHREATRTLVLDRYRRAGFGPDDFGRKREAREALANAVSHAEDRLELTAPTSADREALRDIRRRLELEFGS